MYLKVGNYHTGTRGKFWPEGLDRRVSYFDEVRMGGPPATYADVGPPPGPAEAKPAADGRTPCRDPSPRPADAAPPVE